MRSDQVTVLFPPIKLEEPLAYLRNLRYSYLISDFFNMSEVEMAAYTPPSSLATTRNWIESGRYGKDSADYKDFNTFATALSMIRYCAKINIAIYALRDKYRAEESNRPRYNYISDSQIGMYWKDTTDKDALKIKSAANAAKESIHFYSKKYTTDDFEEKFVNKIKYSVYAICNVFGVETRTMTERATDTGANMMGGIIAFVFFCLAFALLAKCASGNM